MTDLIELAERVERAEGADREIDAAIMAVLFRREDRHIGTTEEDAAGNWAPVTDAVWVSPHTGKWVGTHPHQFSASLDAAMSLVPEGWTTTLSIGRVGIAVLSDCRDDSVEPPEQCATAATPALALTAASLRARAAIASGV